jgi:high affinity Mn2+ porin
VRHPRWLALAVLALAAGAAAAEEPVPASDLPTLLAAQYTFIEQRQSTLESPYEGHLSLHPGGDRQGTHTIGFYSGWGPLPWAQLYLDAEKFMGAGVSDATGLGGLTNGDVIREGVPGIKKEFYIARAYARFMLPLGATVASVARGQDQLPGTEAAQRFELKLGQMSVADDFDRNSYANSARTQFLNWSLWNNTAWDFAANTLGYTDGLVAAYVSPLWSLRYGLYRMPLYANAQTMETLLRAREQDLELTLSAAGAGTVVRLLAYRNTARMGDYAQALAIAAASGMVPDVAADDTQGRHKTGFGVNAEQPLADGGDTGVFVRLGWQDGNSEDFVFTEVDRQASAGAQLSGVHWQRSEDRLGLAAAIQGLSAVHREYLAAGGSGFLLGDGALDYAREKILEAYYRAQWTWSHGAFALRAQLSPDFQYIQNPAFNQDRGPVRFYALRLHLEY